MVISIITRGLIMALGYLYPAYECFKVVELDRPEMEMLRFWCQYWIIIALVTVVERVGDPFISWVPMYSEAKLAFFIYLWYGKTRGTAYVYSTFVRPFVSMHENDIDQNLNELKTRAGDIAYVYWARGSTYFQSRFFELLQYLASQSSAGGASQAPPAVQNAYPPRPPAGYPPAGGGGVGGGGGGMGVGNQPSAPQQPGGGGYPVIPPGLVRPGSGGFNQPSAPQQPPGPNPGFYPGMAGLRSRSASVGDEDEDFHFVDRNPGSNFPDPPVAPSGYLTRSRQRASSTDRPYPPPPGSS